MRQLPPSLALLHCVAQQCEQIETVLTPKSSAYQVISDWVQTESSFGDLPSLIQSEDHIRYIQTLMLSVLSMYGGILIPPIKQFSNTEGTIRIVWDSGIVDDFTLGKWDEGFLKFSQYFQNRLSANPTGKRDINPMILQGFQQYIHSYQVILDAVERRVALILCQKAGVMGILDDDDNRDLLFILLSSVPTEQMNALFVYVQQYFPPDLSYKTSYGNTVNVNAMFQTPATDVTYLIEKTKLYMELYFDSKLPIIKEITRSKTAAFMKKIMQNDSVYNETQANLKVLQSVQVETRKNLYRLIEFHLSSLLRSVSHV